MGWEGILKAFSVYTLPVQYPLYDRHGGIDTKYFATLSLPPSGNRASWLEDLEPMSNQSEKDKIYGRILVLHVESPAIRGHQEAMDIESIQQVQGLGRFSQSPVRLQRVQGGKI